MSAVVSAVKSVAKAVGKTVERVGDAVEKVAEVVVDTVKYVAENPEVLAIAIAVPYAVGAAGAAIGTQTAIQTASLLSQPITAAAITASQGGDLDDIGKAALGSFIGAPVGQYVGAKTGAAIGAQNAAQVALSNAVGGAAGSATGAAIMGQDIGEAATLGAIGSAGASLARSGATELGLDETGKAANFIADIGEGLGRGAITGDVGGELVGSALGTLTREGSQAFNELTTPTKTAATKPAPAPFGAQVGEQMAGTGEVSIAAPASIASRPEFATRPGEEGDIVIKYTDRDGIVTYRKDITSTLPSGEKTGYTIVYDPQTDTVEYEFVSAGDVGSTGGLSITSSKTRPGEKPPSGGTTKPAASEPTGGTTQPAGTTQPSPDIRTGKVTDIASAATGGTTAPATGGTTAPTIPAGPETGGTGAGGRGEDEMAGGTRPVEEMTGSELLGDATGGEDGDLPTEGGGGGGTEGEGAPAGGGGDGLAQQPSDLESMTDEELLALLEDSMEEETPLIPPDDTGEGFRPLDVRIARGGRTGTAYQSSISPRAVGSSPTAAIIGEKEPIFGGDEGVQSEAWNTRSLRLRKALGL